MTDPEQPDAGLSPAPETGHAAIDAACASVELDADLQARHDAVAGALDVLQRALNPPQPRP